MLGQLHDSPHGASLNDELGSARCDVLMVQQDSAAVIEDHHVVPAPGDGPVSDGDHLPSKSDLRRRLVWNPNPRLDELITELEGYLPPFEPGPEHLGFAVPLRLNRRRRVAPDHDHHVVRDRRRRDGRRTVPRGLPARG